MAWMVSPSNVLRQLLSLSLLLQLFLAVSALQVLPNSNCSSVCSPQSTPATTGDDILCYDGDFNTTAKGKAFQDCLSCELQSTEVDSATNQTNVGWALYNLRYAVDWCIFGFPEANNQTSSNPCSQSCNATAALETNILEPAKSTPYDYCTTTDDVTNMGVCGFCYSLIPDQIYLANFLNALKSACQTEAPEGSVFSIPPTQIFTLNPPTAYPTTSASPSTHHISHTAVLALAITLPLVLVLAIAIFAIHWYLRLKKHPVSSCRNPLSNSWGEPSTPHHPQGWNPYAHNSNARFQEIPSPVQLRTPGSWTTVTAGAGHAPMDKGKQSEMSITPTSPSPIAERGRLEALVQSMTGTGKPKPSVVTGKSTGGGDHGAKVSPQDRWG
ncbi:hypothetical protein MMC20_006625 [Loxospora ochrophaea]|nr:hypothetical protein [Loxospora ochrophaea]